MEDETSEKPAYIDWQEFNRLQKGKGVPRPEDDSKDDDASDELEEAVMGKNYLEEEDGEPSVLADIPSASRNQNNQLEDVTEEETAAVSERPDPKDDRDSETNIR